MLLVTMDGCSFSQCRRVVCLHDSNYIQNSILYGYPFCIRLTKLLWRSDVSSSTLALRQQRCTRGEVGLHKFHTVTIDVRRSTLSLRQQDLLPHKSESYAHILYPAKQHRSEAPVGDAFCVSGLQVRGGLSTGRWLTGGTSAGKNGSCMYQTRHRGVSINHPLGVLVESLYLLCFGQESNGSLGKGLDPRLVSCYHQKAVEHVLE